MGSVLQFAAFLSICWLIRGVVTHHNQDKDIKLNNKPSNPNDTGNGDFYFEEKKTDDDNVKTGRPIPQSAWSKEDKVQAQPVENNTGAQFSDKFGFKNVLSYFKNMLQELKKDILGIREMTSLKNSNYFENSQDNSEDKVKQNEIGKDSDTPKPDASTKNTEFEKENQKPKSNYIIDYYQKNGIKFVDDELETSSEESDDSSHKPNEGASIHDDACISECTDFKRKSDRYSSEVGETTAIPTSQNKMTEESDKKFDDAKYDKKEDFKESTTKPSKTSREETESTPISKTGVCMKKNNDNANNINEKNETTEKSSTSAEILTTKSSENKNFNKAKSERFIQNKITDNLSKVTSPLADSRSPGKNSQNIGDSDFDSKSGVLGHSTTLSYQSSKDDIYPDNIGNKPHASGTPTEKPTYRKQQEQITSLKPEEQEQARDNSKSLQNHNRANEYTTASLQSQEAGDEIPNNEMSDDTEIKDSPKESTGKRINANSSHTAVTSSENEPTSKTDGLQTSNSLDTGNTIKPTSSGNIMNTDNLNEDSLDNLNGKRGTNEKVESNSSQQNEKKSETQRDSEAEQTKQQHLNDNSEPEKFLKNKKLNVLNRRNTNKEDDDNLSSKATIDVPSPQDSNREIQNQDVEGSNKSQEEAQKNKENLKEDGMSETSPDQEYEFEEDYEDFDISDELTDMEMDEYFNQNQESELITNDKNEKNIDEMNPDNTAAVLRNEFQISQQTGYMEEKTHELYDTFLEYFYKHSNNPLIQALKNHSNNSSED